MTRQLKRFGELTQIDEMHVLLGQVTGSQIDLVQLYACVASIELHDGVPESVRGQFDVARNMALYTYFFYALAPEVQHKTYTVIELALRLRAAAKRKLTLRPLLERAVRERCIEDSGFRHIENPQPDNPYCRSLPTTLPDLRNTSAHGSSDLSPDCTGTSNGAGTL